MYVSCLLAPLGWIAIGAAGYMLYRAGKKSGEKSVEKQEKKAKAS